MGLFVFFIYNLGIINYISNLEPKEKAPVKDRLIAKEESNWLSEKYKNALNLGAQYGPELYFSDITEIQLKIDNNNFDYSVLPNAINTISNLAYLFNLNLEDARRKSNDCFVEYIKEIQKESQKSDEILHPGLKEKEERRLEESKKVIFWLNHIKIFLFWILKQYTKNLIIAFILLWIWWYEEKKTLRIKNPLSFLFCLIIYPVIIIKKLKDKLKNQTKDLIVITKYRQQQINLFSLFSKDEINEIRKLALVEPGHPSGEMIRHSFLSALTVTLFLTIFSNQAYCSQSQKNFKMCIVQTEQLGPPGVNIISCYFDSSLKLFLDQNPEIQLLDVTDKETKFFDHGKDCLDGFRKKLMHVPKIIINKC